MDKDERELKAIHISKGDGPTLTELIGFHDTDTDKIYVLKDKFAQQSRISGGAGAFC